MMQSSLAFIVLLASREEMHRVWGRFDNQRPGANTNQLMVVIGIVACIFLAMMIWRIVARQPARSFTPENPAKLFRELCAAHRLNFTARRLLKRLAMARGMDNPVLLFVEPQQFDSENLPAELKASAGELRQLRSQLFQ